jgi:hypothetical protein
MVSELYERVSAHRKVQVVVAAAMSPSAVLMAAAVVAMLN